MSGYTKLDSEILTSTIWGESMGIRLTWITMLALADKNGEVHGSIPGLARLAGVPEEDCREGVSKFLAPDPDSRSKEYEGRRIQEIDGGWLLLNHAKYREKYSREWKRERDAERIKERRLREATERDMSQSVANSRVHRVQADPRSQIPDTDAKEEEAFSPPPFSQDRPDPLPPNGALKKEAAAEEAIPKKRATVEEFLQLLGDRLICPPDWFRLGPKPRVALELEEEINRVGGPAAAVEIVFEPAIRERNRPQMLAWYASVLHRADDPRAEEREAEKERAIQRIEREINARDLGGTGFDYESCMRRHRKEAERIYAEKTSAGVTAHV
jgi:hypothetical protein